MDEKHKQFSHLSKDNVLISSTNTQSNIVSPKTQENRKSTLKISSDELFSLINEESKKMKYENEMKLSKKQTELTEEQKIATDMKIQLFGKPQIQLSNQSPEIKQIEEWTQLKFEKIVFDSTKDDWNHKTSKFDEILKAKEKLCFIVKTTDGIIIGGFLRNTLAIERRCF